ncbi:MAG: hypothetical protein HN691_17110 [Bacteroidetes bacterium]|nr:hypothetical protein [Bacteroidota bacterium]
MSALIALLPFLQFKAVNFNADSYFSRNVFNTIIICSLIVSLGFTLMFILNPSGFSKMGLEGNFIEKFSALAFFVCALFFGLLFLKIVKRAPFIYSIANLGFAFLFFLIGMEEVSWFQHTLELETPIAFSNNIQGEMNLHNFATPYFETAYYFGSFVFLIILTFIHNVFGVFKNSKFISTYVPSSLVFFVGSIFISYNYDMWNVSFMQWSFIITLIILLYYLFKNESQYKFIALLCVFALLFSQSFFLLLGDRFVRLWDVTEYKEFFIPLAFMIYSVEILVRTKKDSFK